MKIKIFRRTRIHYDKPKIDAFGFERTSRHETQDEYEQRINEFLQTVNVVDIKTELDGDITDGSGYLNTYLIIMYEEK